MDAAKKRRIKSTISWILMGAMVLSVVGIVLKDNQKKNAAAALAVESAVITRGHLESTIRGGGKLTLEKSEVIEIPGDVKIASWLVDDGSMVKPGQAVAKIDPVSLNQEILTVQTAIIRLTEKIAAAQEETRIKVKSPISGRVEQIYASEGEDVLTVMMRDGALALFSLDGQMQVELEVETDLVPGDSVELELVKEPEETSESEEASSESSAKTSSEESGEEAPAIVGRVETNLNGKLLITVPDEGYTVDSTVIVSKDGEILGEGTFSVHDAWKLTDVTGTIQTIHVKENQQVEPEDLLLTILALSPAKAAKVKVAKVKVAKAATPLVKVVKAAKAPHPAAKVAKALSPAAKVAKAPSPAAKVAKALSPAAKVVRPLPKAAKVVRPPLRVKAPKVVSNPLNL